MNRERRCLGGNSYQKDLSFDPLEFLAERLRTNESVAWLDLCCGSGKALIEAATVFADKYSPDENLSNHLQIIGIDLAGIFQPFPCELKHLRLLETSVEDFETVQEFDLITSVHGFHYIGDKLSIVQKYARTLKADGLFLANLDLRNLKFIGKQNSSRTFSRFLRGHGFTVDNRKHLLVLNGRRNFELPFEYLGACDNAGPNYTKQPAVDSYYRMKTGVMHQGEI